MIRILCSATVWASNTESLMKERPVFDAVKVDEILPPEPPLGLNVPSAGENGWSTSRASVHVIRSPSGSLAWAMMVAVPPTTVVAVSSTTKVPVAVVTVIEIAGRRLPELPTSDCVGRPELPEHPAMSVAIVPNVQSCAAAVAKTQFIDRMTILQFDCGLLETRAAARPPWPARPWTGQGPGKSGDRRGGLAMDLRGPTR